MMLVSSKAVPGREGEYLEWYLGTHLREVCAVPGFISGKLYTCSGPDGMPTGELNAVYEVEARPPSELFAALMARREEMILSDALDVTSVKFTFLEPVRHAQ
jgi:hypothetical protein